MDSADSEPESSAAVELTFPDSSDLSYPDSTNVGIEGEEASTGDLRDQLVTPEPNLDDKHGLSGISNHNVPDTSSDLPNPPDAPSISNDIDDAETNARDVSITPTAFKSFSIDLSTNLAGHISTDDSRFCLSRKDKDEDERNEVDDSSADEQNTEMDSRSYVNGEAHHIAPSASDETRGETIEGQSSPKVNAVDEYSDMAADASSDMVIEAQGVTIEAPSPNLNIADESSDMAVEASDSPAAANLTTPKDIKSPVSATLDPPTSTTAELSSLAVEISPAFDPPTTESNDKEADDYMDSDVINDIDDSVAEAEVQKVDSSTAQTEELPAVDPSDWHQFPLVFFDEEEEKKLRASNEDPDDGASRSRHTSSARSTPDIPEDGETRPSTPNWSTDGSSVLETFDDLINLLPCDLRGWAIHKSDCGNRLALIHSVVDFKTLDLKSDVMVVFERERQKLKKYGILLFMQCSLNSVVPMLLDPLCILSQIVLQPSERSTVGPFNTAPAGRRERVSWSVCSTQ